MGLEGLRDIKPPVYFPVNYPLLILISIIFLLLLLILAIKYFLRRVKSKRPVSSVEKLKPAHQIAYEALEALQAKNLPALAKIKEFYFELSDIVRHYLENRFNLRAPEMTTEEFLYSLPESKELADNHKDLLKEFLSHCDLVKFAKYGPTQKEIDDSFKAAKRLVDETKLTEEGLEK